ncbi:MAG: 4-(cytidine 5'-diphospho)-2-C-methyl-D-erythritol kinase [Actinobacteria bacterium]|nr:4-(cytidine 5'-diphospho)-2-C-methyl-D-erythritol kinase [Actinomycetota bacterium]
MLGAKTLARAKINLFLSVGPRREDGYHEIRSVMQALELSDELYFRRTDGSRGRVTLRCSDGDLPAGEGNLVWRAIETFAGETGVMDEGGIEVFINKRIPVGAGLAGGSADAAAALLAMNHIWELEMSPAEIESMAARVGSDVPFCLHGGTAMVTGRGEKVQPLEPLPSFQAVVASPGEQVSTADVYRRFDTVAGESGLTGKEELERALSGLLEGVKIGDFEAVCANLHNSLESATIARDRLELYKKTALEAGAAAALMTGSGPAVFALTRTLEDAAGVAWELEKTAPITIITGFADRGAQIAD